jgi:hypothetical protein
LLQILNEMTINKTPCMHCTELTLQQWESRAVASRAGWPWLLNTFNLVVPAAMIRWFLDHLEFMNI